MPKLSDLNEHGLSIKQQDFCDYLLADPGHVAKDAALKAGYSPGSAGISAWRLLQNPKVAKYLDKRKMERMETMKIDSDYVLNRLLEIDQLDVIDIVDFDSEGAIEFKPLNEWPREWRQSISGMDVQHLQNGHVNKIKWPDKAKNLEMLGKHIAVNAFVKEPEEDKEVQPLNISFSVAEPVSDINVTRGDEA